MRTILRTAAVVLIVSTAGLCLADEMRDQIVAKERQELDTLRNWTP